MLNNVALHRLGVFQEIPMHTCDHSTPEALYPVDARGIAKRFRHAAIFGAFDALLPGETMRFCNDHDPLPLLGQLQAHYAQAISINYVQREPGAIVIDFAKLA
jgi:uncharacterized protein (DUF2249 family)